MRANAHRQKVLLFSHRLWLPHSSRFFPTPTKATSLVIVSNELFFSRCCCCLRVCWEVVVAVLYVLYIFLCISKSEQRKRENVSSAARCCRQFFGAGVGRSFFSGEESERTKSSCSHSRRCCVLTQKKYGFFPKRFLFFRSLGRYLNTAKRREKKETELVRTRIRSLHKLMRWLLGGRAVGMRWGEMKTVNIFAPTPPPPNQPAAGKSTSGEEAAARAFHSTT